MDRFRPILMTTLAAVMGAVPIALGFGADGASRRPLGLVIVGGLIVSQFITLYITPVIYLYLEWFQERCSIACPSCAARTVTTKRKRKSTAPRGCPSRSQSAPGKCASAPVGKADQFVLVHGKSEAQTELSCDSTYIVMALRTCSPHFACRRKGAVVALLALFATFASGYPAQSAAPSPPPAPRKLENLSTRLDVQTGENVSIVGFIITGNAPKKILLRGIGPSLKALSPYLADPVLELHDSDGSLISTNDNWKAGSKNRDPGDHPRADQ